MISFSFPLLTTFILFSVFFHPQTLVSSAATPTNGSYANVNSNANSNLVFSYYYYSTTGIQPADIPCDRISHLIWSFANIHLDGTVTLNGPTDPYDLYSAISKPFPSSSCGCSGKCLDGQLYQMFLLKQRCSHMKLLLSIGGWVWSSNFSSVFQSSQARQKAILTSTQLMKTYGFDGLDIDWEFPATPRDKTAYPSYTSNVNADISNFAIFLQETKSYWASIKSTFLLTAALSARVVQPTNSAWKTLYDSIDYGLIMAYEFHHNTIRTRPGAPWTFAPGDSEEEKQNTVFYGLQTYAQIGFPISKMILGIPMYAVGWSNLQPNYDYSPELPGMKYPLTNGAKMATPVPYNVLVSQKYQTYFDDKRVSTTYFSGDTVLFAESPKSVELKVNLMKSAGLPGVMLWNSNQDTMDSNSLLFAISKVLPISKINVRSSKFCMPSSEFCNVRCDFTPSPNKTTSTTSKSPSAYSLPVSSSRAQFVVSSASQSLRPFFGFYTTILVFIFYSFL